jgi:hypothetical protein
MKPGVELDTLVLEKVLGWQWRRYQWYDGTYRSLLWHESMGEPRGDDFNNLPDGRLVSWYGPSPSTNMDDAMKVVKKMREEYGFHGNNGFTLTTQDGYMERAEKWYCEFPQPNWEYGDGETPAHAICIAALKAIGEDPHEAPEA